MNGIIMLCYFKGEDSGSSLFRAHLKVSRRSCPLKKIQHDFDLSQRKMEIYQR